MSSPNQIDLFSSQEGSHANHSPLPGSERARKMTGISGQLCLKQYGYLLPAGSLVKMLVASLLGTEEWYSTKCMLTWKPRVTKSGRLLFQLAPSTPRTGGTGSGLLPTARAGDAKGGAYQYDRADHTKPRP